MPQPLPQLVPMQALITNPVLHASVTGLSMASIASPATVQTPGLSVSPSASEATEPSMCTPRSTPSVAVPTYSYIPPKEDYMRTATHEIPSQLWQKTVREQEE